LEFRLSALTDSDLAWVNGRAIDKADAMLMLSSALYYREPFTILFI